MCILYARGGGGDTRVTGSHRGSHQGHRSLVVLLKMAYQPMQCSEVPELCSGGRAGGGYFCVCSGGGGFGYDFFFLGGGKYL